MTSSTKNEIHFFKFDFIGKHFWSSIYSVWIYRSPSWMCGNCERDLPHGSRRLKTAVGQYVYTIFSRCCIDSFPIESIKESNSHFFYILVWLSVLPPTSSTIVVNYVAIWCDHLLRNASNEGRMWNHNDLSDEGTSEIKSPDVLIDHGRLKDLMKGRGARF